MAVTGIVLEHCVDKSVGEACALHVDKVHAGIEREQSLGLVLVIVVESEQEFFVGGIVAPTHKTLVGDVIEEGGCRVARAHHACPYSLCHLVGGVSSHGGSVHRVFVRRSGS